jgi:hypothetical protein
MGADVIEIAIAFILGVNCGVMLLALFHINREGI